VIDLWRLFYALGDPHRLEIIHRLADRGPLSMARLTEGMPFSRQGGAKHLAVLTSAGLVSLERRGREKVVTLERRNLHLPQMFLRQMGEVWDDRLHLLEQRLALEDEGGS
jgi:DNA-binding transcriptional ArsR family regulator